jgi:hypothetical protein
LNKLREGVIDPQMPVAEFKLMKKGAYPKPPSAGDFKQFGHPPPANISLCQMYTEAA